MQEEQLFHQALAEPAERRADFIDAACGEDAGLRQRVEVLLQAHDNPGSFLNTPGQNVDIDATIAMPVSIEVGSNIGPYKIREQIGEGGMGVVFVAEQTKPIRRKVALKIIKPGMDTRQVIARFEAERQALALMHNPNIARVHDAGATDTGRPYFVMELVRGLPITEYCDKHRLSTKDRLALFITVCRAVQHAHLKGIIHRDLKPSNVLVTRIDGTGVPKVIDFGVAKATNQQLTERSIYTHYSQMVGTPLYMSPEQAEMSGVDIDTRTDVYSLGVLLYELLTGCTPFDRETMRQATHDEMRRIIREDEPLRPSLQISTLKADALTTHSQQRASEPRKLALVVRGELDWIVMKALDKDRNRRYESASAFAADIERYLIDEPVAACPPSAVYRLQKYARRNKGMIAGIVAVSVTLAIGTAASLWQAQEVTSAHRLAENRLETMQEQQALADTDRSRSRTLQYVSDMKFASDAQRDGDVPRVVSLLDRHRHYGNEEDPRGFAWHYLNKTVRVPENWKFHGERPIRDMKISPDGQTVAIVTQGQIGFRRCADGALLQTLTTEFKLTSVAWHPGGKFIATTDESGFIRVWGPDHELPASQTDIDAVRSTLADGASPFQVTRTLSFRAHDGIAHSVCFTPDGKTIASSGQDRTIRTWDSSTGNDIAVFEGHLQSIQQIDISPDGALIASASGDGTCAVWDLNTGLITQKWSSPTAARMACVRFSPDGSQVAAGDILGNLFVADVKSGASTFTTQLDGIESLMFFDDSSRIAVGDRGGAVHIWSLKQERHPRFTSPATSKWAAHRGRVQALVVGRGSDTVMSGSRDGSVASWPFVDAAIHWPCSIGQDFTVANDGSVLVCERAVDQFNLDTRRVSAAMLSDRGLWKVVAAAEDCSRIAAADLAGTVVVYDLKQRTEIARWHRKHQPLRIAISPDGHHVAIAWSDQREWIDLFNVASSSDSLRIVAPQCKTIVFSPDGRLLAVGSQDDLLLYELGESVPFTKLVGHDTALTDAAFHPDGLIVATVSNDRHLKLWEVATGKELNSTEAHHGDIESVDFSRGGRVLATGGDDNIVRVWHAETMQPLLEIETPFSVKKVQFGAQEKRLIVRLEDHHVHVYDAADSVSVHSTGNAVADATQAIRLAGTNRTTYALKNAHELWKYNVNTDEFESIDASLERKSIPQVSGDFLPYLKGKHKFWWANADGTLEFVVTIENDAKREYVADGERLFMLKANPQGQLTQIWHIDADRNDPYVPRRIACHDGPKKIYAGNGILYSFLHDGRVYRWDNTTYDYTTNDDERVDVEPGWTEIVTTSEVRQIVLSRSRLWALSGGGQVWRLDGEALPRQFATMDGRIPVHPSGTASIAAHPNSDVVAFVCANGEVRRLNLGAEITNDDELWPMLDRTDAHKSISVDGEGRIFMVRAAGQLWQIYPQRKQYALE